jgi:hypothetical protein
MHHLSARASSCQVVLWALFSFLLTTRAFAADPAGFPAASAYAGSFCQAGAVNDPPDDDGSGGEYKDIIGNQNGEPSALQWNSTLDIEKKTPRHLSIRSRRRGGQSARSVLLAL